MRGLSISESHGRSAVTDAVREGDWTAARLALAERLAEAADATDSARDLKSIARSLTPLLDRCEIDEARQRAAGDTPLSRIMAEAEGISADARAGR